MPGSGNIQGFGSAVPYCYGLPRDMNDSTVSTLMPRFGTTVSGRLRAVTTVDCEVAHRLTHLGYRYPCTYTDNSPGQSGWLYATPSHGPARSSPPITALSNFEPDVNSPSIRVRTVVPVFPCPTYESNSFPAMPAGSHGSPRTNSCTGQDRESVPTMDLMSTITTADESSGGKQKSGPKSNNRKARRKANNERRMREQAASDNEFLARKKQAPETSDFRRQKALPFSYTRKSNPTEGNDMSGIHLIPQKQEPSEGNVENAAQTYQENTCSMNDFPSLAHATRSYDVD